MKRILLALVALVAWPATASAASAPIDIGLVIDGSGSISSADWTLQRDGFTTALRDPANVPLDGSVAITVVQFSSGTTTEVPRTLIDSQETLDGVVGAIASMRQRGNNTDTGTGIAAATGALAPLRDDAKSVICVSTDGTVNTGTSLTSAVQTAKAGGIDRLSVIGIEDGSTTANVLRSEYGPHVYGGGAVTIARNTVEFATLIGGSCFGDAVTLRALEVNQGVQDWVNSQLLLETRETVVRAFVETPPGAPDERVTGRLIGRRGGVELPGSPLAASNASGNVLARQDIVSRRGRLEDSLNFQLPLSWTSGGDLELEFDAGGAPVNCREPSTAYSAPGDCRDRVSFDPPTKLGATFFTVAIGDEDGPSFSDVSEQISRVRSLLPVSIMNTSTRMLHYDERPSLNELNDDLHRTREIERTSCGSGCFEKARDVYYGLLDGPSIDYNGMAIGIPGDAASSFTNRATTPGASSYARNTIAHELSHTLGVHHAVDNALGVDHYGFLWLQSRKTGRCGEVASASAPGHSPFITVDSRIRPGLGSLADVDREIWGFDHRFVRGDVNGLAISDPRSVWALMSYCSDGRGQYRWPSGFEWQHLIGGLRTFGGASWDEGERESAADVVAPPAGSRGLLIGGSINAETGTATVGDALPLPYGGDAAPGAGDYTLRVEDASGAVLAERKFTPLVPADDTSGELEKVGTFIETVAVPETATVARVVVSHATQGVLGSKDAGSGPAPAIGDVSISDLTIAGQPVTLDWAGGARSAVLFSADGVTWTPLAFGLSGKRMEIDPDLLSQTTGGQFAVATTDGLRGDIKVLGGVTVTNSAPTVKITSPRPDDAAPSGLQPILFEAVIGDRDEELPDSAVRWSSDRDGVLGTGRSLTVSAADLAEGVHRITATVTDAHGATATDTVTIEVFRVAPPPPSADKRLSATGPAGDVVGGDETAIVATVVNDGPSTSRNLRLTATFPAGTAPVLPSDLAGWTCEIGGADLVCSLEQLATGATSTLTLPVATDAVSARTTRTLALTVDASVADPRPDDDRTTVSFAVVPRPQTAAATPTPSAQAASGAAPAPAVGAAAVPQRASAKRLAVRVRESRAQLLTSKFNVGLRVGCGPLACRATATATVRIGGRTWRLKTVRANVRGGRSAWLRMSTSKALRRAARSALRRDRKLTIVATVAVRAADGSVGTKRVRIPVRRLHR